MKKSDVQREINSMTENRMNERIKELMYHAGLTAQGCWNELDDYDREAIEKFAELIIQESIEVMMTHDYHGEWLGEKLKEHFGVKE